MEEIDAEVLITLVEAKPVLWDKTEDIYKDRIATRKAWEEVCVALKPDFESLSEAEKNTFGKDVIKRWTNLRDGFAKSKRDARAAKKSGSEGKKRKKYVFSDQLQFLNKIYTDRYTIDSMEPETEQEQEKTIGDEVPSSASHQTKCRKHKKPDDMELKMMKALEPKTPCSKMSFLHSLMPHLQNYSDRELLQFQMGVLQVIENINKSKETASLHQPNFSSSMSSYQPVPQYMPQPPQCLQQTTFPQQHSFTSQHYTGPHSATSTSSSFTQQQSLAQNVHGLQRQSTSVHQETRPHKAKPPIENLSTSQYLQGYCYSDSSQSDNLTSPSISPSVESNYSDVF